MGDLDRDLESRRGIDGDLDFLLTSLSSLTRPSAFNILLISAALADAISVADFIVAARAAACCEAIACCIIKAC